VPGCRFEGLSGGVEGQDVELRVGVNGVGGGSAVAHARGGGSAFIGDRHLQGWFESQPRRHGRGTAATSVVGRQRSARHGRGASYAWSRRIGSGRRFGEGGPTAHRPAGGGPPRRLGPARSLARLTLDAGAMAHTGTPRTKTTQTGRL
jgi:hypothetical protein